MKIKSIFMPSKWVHKFRVILEKFQGLDFLSVINPEDLGLDSKLAYISSPSGNRYLINVLNDCNITTEDRIIDIGCGKGSAMRTMMQFPFARVDGIELSDRLATIAKQNFKKLNANKTIVINVDATLFKNYDDYNMVYFYNPFPSTVMQFVISAIIESLQRYDRELVIIYNNPTCHEIVVSKDAFIKIGVRPDEWGNSIFIYSNRRLESSRLLRAGFVAA